MPLSLAQAERLLATTTHDPHLLLHARNVRGCMEAFARHFGQPPEEVEHWGAVGYLHDYDYELFPAEHLAHTEKELLAEGVDPADVRAILSHGCTADELSGIVWATSLMRPTGLSDLEPRSVLKKFKDRKFAAKCSREVILRGAELLGMDLADVVAVCIDGMRAIA